ncbi:MAG: thiamine phosphate synthase [Chloroflexota bacterium]|nr:thiamine phosphate synthase [Chloroflexota bacterium]
MRGKRAHLQLVTVPRPDLLTAIAGAVRGGADSVQLRDCDASAHDMYALARDAVHACADAGAAVFVNDRVDVARATGASGAHLGSDGLPLQAARAVLETWQQVGVSVHSIEEAIAAARGGADYLVYGHVYPTASHPGEPGRGIPALRAVVVAVDIPVLAIGGIDPGRVPEVMATGCAGVAAISAVLDRSDPELAARSLRAALDASGEPGRSFQAAETRRPGCEKLDS